jgi:hypothetical protein
MRRCLLSLALAVAVFPPTHGEQAKAGKTNAVATSSAPASVTSESASKKDPPLLLADDKPLLLDDGPAASTPEGSCADNSRCQVCHLNMTLELISVTHAKANLGCARCHGDCDAHIADESWASGGKGTPPELMYPRYKINALCRECHSGEKDRVNRKGPRCPKLLGQRTPRNTCTECHGTHRLVERRCKWK